MTPQEILSRLSGWEDGAGRPSARLATALAAAIADGRLPDGVRLPSERALAAAVGISRGTVVRTYDRLRRGGLVHTRHGSGTVVGPAGRAAGRADALAGALPAQGTLTTLTDDRDGTAIDLRLAAWPADPALLARMADRYAARLAEVGTAHDGYWPLGLPALRAALAARLTRMGLPSEPDQIVVTSGAQQSLDVALTTLAAAGDTVVVPEVTWPGVIELMAVRGLRPAAVRTTVDHHVDQVALLRHLREGRSPVACLVSTFDNPTGVVMPAPVRRLVVEAALASGTALIDDLSLAEMWFDEPPPAPLAASVADAGGRVVTVGSLAKVTWGGLRIGWLRAEGPLLDRLSRVRTVMDLGNDVPSQVTALALTDVLDDLVAARRARAIRSWEVLEAGLTAQLPAWSCHRPAGGLSAWVHLGGASGEAFVATAARHGVRLSPPRLFHVLGQDSSYVRITLTSDTDVLHEAIARLAGAWDDHRRRQQGQRLALV